MSPAKTDNANLESKLELRRHMLRRHHADGDIRVFDCCQGSGVIWGKLRGEFPVKSYWGVDVKPKKGRLKVDSRRVVCQPDLRCNVIDIDTYGMPWEHWTGLIPNVSEPATVFLTVGLKMPGGGSPLPALMKATIGIPGDWPLCNAFTGTLGDMAIQVFLSQPAANGFRVVEAFESSSGARARYLAVRLDRPAPEPKPEPEPAKGRGRKQR